MKTIGLVLPVYNEAGNIHRLHERLSATLLKLSYFTPKFKLVLLAFLVLQSGLIPLRSPLTYVVLPFLAARFFTTWSAFDSDYIKAWCATDGKNS